MGYQSSANGLPPTQLGCLLGCEDRNAKPGRLNLGSLSVWSFSSSFCSRTKNRLTPHFSHRWPGNPHFWVGAGLEPTCHWGFTAAWLSSPLLLACPSNRLWEVGCQAGHSTRTVPLCVI